MDATLSSASACDMKAEKAGTNAPPTQPAVGKRVTL
jgi:hypothetical protein